MLIRPLAAALVIGALTLPAAAQEAVPSAVPSAAPPAAPPAASPEGAKEATPPRPIRNAPNPRALEFAAYIFSAVNVCGYQLGTAPFEALLAKQNTTLAAVSPRGPFGGRVMGIFSLMSNQMNLNREQSCLAVAGEYGPEGSVAKNVLLPPGSAEPPASEPAAPAVKPAQP